MLVDPKTVRTFAVVGNAVLTKAVLVTLGFFAGRWLDQRFGTTPIFMMLLVVVGLSLGIYWLMRVLKRIQQ